MKFLKHTPVVIISLLAILFITMAISSEGVYGSSDNYTHYFIARYGFTYPQLLLDHWGKPVYTLLMAPFSQGGLIGIKLINVILALSTSWLCYRICKHLNFTFPWLAILFCMFFPMYFIVSFSALTEILFSFLLTLGVFLFLTKKHLTGSILISLLPFVRTEGFFIITFFIVALVLNKKWKNISFLFAGTVLYSIIGGLYFDDFLWIIHQNPYKAQSAAIYGHGNFLHFFDGYKEITGLPLILLFIIGLLSYFIKPLHHTQTKVSHEYFLLIPLVAIAYFMFHVIVWWQGWAGSAGLTRVMAGILPLIGITALAGLNAILQLLHFSSVAQKIITLGLVIWIMILPFKQWHLPYPYEEREKTIQRTAAYIQRETNRSKVYCFDPLFFYFLEQDPYNKQQSERVYGAASHFMKTGELFIWDSHFAPYEGSTSLDSVLNDSRLSLLFKDKNLHPNPGHVDGFFEVYVFKRK